MHSDEHSSVPTSRPKLTTLDRIVALALLGMGLIYLLQVLLIWLMRHIVVPALLVPTVLALLVVGLIVGRRGWATGLGVLIALAPIVTTLLNPLAASALLHPASNLATFGVLIVQFACAVVAGVSGVAAAIQHGERHTPSFLAPFLTALTGLIVGMLILATIVAASPSSVATPSTTNGMPTVHMAGNTFLTNVILVSKGDKLVLVDDDTVEHIIQNGSWTPSGMPHQQQETGAPAIEHLDLKGGSAVVGPFPTAGIFRLYCTIHQGMNLTVVVQ